MILLFIMLLLCIITLHAPSESTRAPGPSMRRVYTWAAMGAGVSPGIHPMQRAHDKTKRCLSALNLMTLSEVKKEKYSSPKVKRQLISAFKALNIEKSEYCYDLN